MYLSFFIIFWKMDNKNTFFLKRSIGFISLVADRKFNYQMQLLIIVRKGEIFLQNSSKKIWLFVIFFILQ